MRRWRAGIISLTLTVAAVLLIAPSIQASESKIKDLVGAVPAGPSAGREFSSLAKCNPATNEDFSFVLAEMSRLRKESRERSIRERLQLMGLLSCLTRFSSHTFQQSIATTLTAAEKDIPAIISGQSSRADIFEDFDNYFVYSLGKACATARNRHCIEPLWRLVDKGGVPSTDALDALASYRDPAQFPSLIERNRRGMMLNPTKFGPAATSDIISALRTASPSAADRKNLLRSLRLTRSIESIKILLSVSRDADTELAEVADYAVLETLKMSPETSIAVLNPMLRSKSGEARRQALAFLREGLWEPDLARAVKAILRGDPDEENRVTAVDLLAKNLGLSARSDLKKATRDRSEQVQEAAKSALINFEDTDSE